MNYDCVFRRYNCVFNDKILLFVQRNLQLLVEELHVSQMHVKYYATGQMTGLRCVD